MSVSAAEVVVVGAEEVEVVAVAVAAAEEVAVVVVERKPWSTR